ncbi:MAG: hypothetical protein OES47_03135, partial [Acidobacteriota bacterium]|nr:hypothetical protein [Acidobacteriota bacterium]
VGGGSRSSVPTGRGVVDRASAGVAGATAFLDPPAPRPVGKSLGRAGTTERIDLPPFPQISESTPIEEILLVLRNRLRLLYRVATSGGEQDE